MAKIILLCLTLLAACSPVFTLARLWQVKEWRWDRLLEHLRRDGVVTQLYGVIRPYVLIMGTVASVPLLFSRPYTIHQVGDWGWDVPFDMSELVAMILGVLTLLFLVQLARRRQPVPVWTTKTAILVCITLVLLQLAAIWILTSNENTLVPGIGGRAFFPSWFPMEWNSFGTPRRLFGLLLLPYLAPLFLTMAWGIFWPVDRLMKKRIMQRAKALRNAHPDWIVIGVTGSVGKTTTKELLACVLQDLNPIVTPAYVNSEIGVAQWLIRALGSANYSLPNTTSVVIAELGAYKKGEIALMCSYLQPTMGVVTAVSEQHVALFGSLQNVFEAKSELIKALPQNGHAFLNGDNELARKMKDLSVAPVTIVGTGGNADIEAFDIEETGTGIRFRAWNVVFEIPFYGTHNVTNILLALSVGVELGVEPLRMREHLKKFSPPSKTFSVRSENGVRILDDTHNSSAASIKAAIAWAKNQPEQKKTLLMAGLIEMGELQAPAERELGSLASQVFDRIVVVDSMSAKHMKEGGAAVEKLAVNTLSLQQGALLVCVGRIAPSVIHRLIPNN